MFALQSPETGRRLRYMKKPDSTFEVTTSAIQGRLLLRPSKELNRIILGILGRFLGFHGTFAALAPLLHYRPAPTQGGPHLQLSEPSSATTWTRMVPDTTLID